MNRIAVLFSGVAGSGKDTCAAALGDRFGFRRFAIADSLKDVTHDLASFFSEIFHEPFGRHRHFYDDIDLKDSKCFRAIDKTPRELCIQVGTNILRYHLGDEIFVRGLVNQVIISSTERVVVTDCRFQSDLDFIRAQLESNGFRCLHLHLDMRDHMTVVPDVGSDYSRDPSVLRVESIKGQADKLVAEVLDIVETRLLL